ncbi:MAG: DUF5119 domain-containing protein [Bacteroidales bacterium]|nr:DUF5119 domain-containing protein [Bacteroidales bacterium]
MCNLKRIASLVLTLSVIIAAASCEHKELCYYHPHVAPVRVNVDWSLFPMDEPTGMTAYAYPLHEDENDIYRFISHNINYITLELEAGFFHTLVFNQSESEYGTLEFSNLEDYNTAQVRVLQTKSNWYATKAPDTKVGTEPEWLAVGTAENVEVTEEMVRIAEEEFLANRQEQMMRAIGRAINDVATVTPISVIKQVEFRVYCEGLYNLRSVRASVDGMAEGCILATGEVTQGSVSHTIDAWSIEEYEYDITRGELVATLGTFGIPSGHTGKPEENKFSIHLMLVDNQTTVDYDFNIGDLLTEFKELDGSNGELQKVVVKLRLPEKLPDVKPVDGVDGGFDVDFSGWGDEIVTVIPS